MLLRNVCHRLRHIRTTRINPQFNFNTKNHFSLKKFSSSIFSENDTSKSIKNIEIEVDKVNNSISEVEKLIIDTEIQINALKSKPQRNKDELKYLREKESSLREKKSSLRQKEAKFLDMLLDYRKSSKMFSTSKVENLVISEHAKSLLIANEHRFLSEAINEDKQSKLLQSMKDLKTKISLGSGVEVLDFKYPIATCNFAPTCLFIRSWYSRFYNEVRNNETSIIISNPGVGKSMYQFYILACLLNPGLLGPLSKDFHGSVEPYKVVIRQIGTDYLYVMFLQTCEVVSLEFNPLIFKYFDSKTTLYLFEPGYSIVEPVDVNDIITIATVPPNESRYKQISKLGGTCHMYFPILELDELLAIRTYLVENTKLSLEELEFLSIENVKERFNLFGGIFRNVFPRNSRDLAKINHSKNFAIDNVNLNHVLLRGQLDPVYVSHFIAKMVVDQRTFRSFQLQIISEDVLSKINYQFNMIDQRNRVLSLKRNLETGFMASICPYLFEDAIFYILNSPGGFSWLYKDVNPLNPDFVIKEGEVCWKSQSLVEGTIPHFTDMQSNVVYKSLNRNHKAIKAIMKTKESELIFFQMKWLETKSLKLNININLANLTDNLNKYKIPEGTHIIYALFSKPGKEALISLDSNSKEMEEVKKKKFEKWTWRVFQVPKDFVGRPSKDDDDK